VTLGKLLREAAERIAGGEQDVRRLVDEFTAQVLDDASLTRQAVRQLIEKRIKDALSSYLKPPGVTPRVPAGQMSWTEMEPTAALSKMRAYIRDAITREARAERHAAIIGYIDASGLEPSDFSTLGDLCTAAGVPAEYVATLAA
jgi:hypothetical protein